MNVLLYFSGSDWAVLFAVICLVDLGVVLAGIGVVRTIRDVRSR
jgi:hypothetical protein